MDEKRHSIEWHTWERLRYDARGLLIRLPGPPCPELERLAVTLVSSGKAGACGCNNPRHGAAVVFPTAQCWLAVTCALDVLPELRARLHTLAQTIAQAENTTPEAIAKRLLPVVKKRAGHIFPIIARWL